TGAVGRRQYQGSVTGAGHHPGAHPAQGGLRARRAELDRYGDHGGPGGEPHDHFHGASGVRDRRAGGDRTSSTTGDTSGQGGRGKRGTFDRPDVLGTARRPCPLDLTAARRPLRAARWGGRPFPRTGATSVKKSQLKPWLKECWVIPPKANAAFVAAMEDVLEVYTRPYDPRFPQ